MRNTVEEQNNKPEKTSSESVSKEHPQSSDVDANAQQSQDTDESQTAIETYQQTARSDEPSTTYTAQGTVPSDSDGVHVAPATISTPFHALKAIILKPNPVFARLKETANWSWVPFLIVAFCTALPTWLYFNSVDMNWYADLIVQVENADVSPAEQAQLKQMMMQENLGGFTAVASVISQLLMFAVFALYLHKMTQIDEENTLTYGDWYGFLWWVSIPFAIFSLITSFIILANGGPEIKPEILAPFSLGSILGLSLGSDWFGWAQGIGPDAFWCIYLMTVGISQWTQLSSRQCLIIAAAPFAIIWGVWAAFIIF